MSSRLEKALRRHEAKRLLPKMLAQLSKALGIAESDLVVLGLEETDAVSDAFRQARTRATAEQIPSWKRRFPEREREVVAQLLSRISGLATEEEWVLLHTLGRICGGVVLTNRTIIDHAMDLVSLDQDECHALSNGGETGLVLALVTDYSKEGRKPGFELMLWGDLAHQQNERFQHPPAPESSHPAE